jgi:tetratricopeptide (TPR) repeat protein
LIAEAHRKLHSWAAALKSADSALAIDPKDADAQFYRACALAQLRRPIEAVAALKKAIELDDELFTADELEEEADLKPLAGVSAFKKFVAELRRSEQAEAEPQKKEPDSKIRRGVRTTCQTRDKTRRHEDTWGEKELSFMSR